MKKAAIQIATLAFAVSVSAVVLEDWQMNDADGTKMKKLINLAGAATFAVNNDGVVATNGHLRASYFVSNYGLLSNAGLTTPNLTNGNYTIETKFSAGSNVNSNGLGGSFTIGLSDINGDDRTDLWSIGLINKAEGLRLQVKVDKTRTDVHYFNSHTLTNDLVVRAEVDLDYDLLDVYYTIGTNSEQSVKNLPVNDGAVDVVRLNVGNQKYVAGDWIEVDYITFSENTAPPSDPYDDWTSLYGLSGSDTNLTANPDGDALNNLYEYALGGDPTNGSHTGYASSFQTVEDGGTNWMEYAYTKRNDAAARGLDYHLELNTTLIGGSWTNDGYTVSGTSIFDADFDTVTNRIPTAADNNQFIQLKIIKN